MRKILIGLLLMCAATAHAQVKISALPAYPGSLSSTVRIPSSDLSLSTTQSYYLTTPQIQSYLESLSNTWSAQQNFSSSMVLGSPTGGALGSGTLNAATGVYVNGTPVPTYPQTAAEIAAGVTPVNYGYPVGALVYAQRYGAKCDGVTDDSTAISNAAKVAVQEGGATVLGCQGTSAIANGVVVNGSRVVFSAAHFGDGSHDTGSNDNGWTWKWTGPSGGTMLTMAPTPGASNQALYGNGAQGITFDCANSASIGLEIESVKGGTWNGLYFVECTTAGLDTIPVSTLGEASDVQGNLFIGIRSRIYLSTGAGIRLRGVSGHNTSFDSFYNLQLNYKNGDGILLQNTDNLNFTDVQEFNNSGTGYGVELSGDTTGSANSIFFYDLSAGSGGVKIRGTETNPTAVKNVQFLGYDLANNMPAPSLGAGVTGITIYKENGHLSGAGMVNGAFGETDSSLSTAIADCPSTASICIYNGSQDGTDYFDGTGEWSFNQDGSHNLRIERLAGSGNLNIASSSGSVALSVNGGLSETTTGATCSMSAGTSCTATVPTGSGHCAAYAQGATAYYAACSVSGTTATVTANASNSATWLVTATQ